MRRGCPGFAQPCQPPAGNRLLRPGKADRIRTVPVDRGLFDGRMCNVEVEIESELTMGRTVVDWWDRLGKPKNALVIGTADTDGVYALLTEALARFEKQGF